MDVGALRQSRRAGQDRARQSKARQGDSSRLVGKCSRGREREAEADAAARAPLALHGGGGELHRVPETARGRERPCWRGEPCGAGHGVAPFGGGDDSPGRAAAAAGARRAAAADGRARLSRAGREAAAVAVALLDHVRLEGQGSSDAVEFLPKKRRHSVYWIVPTFHKGEEGTRTKNNPQALQSG
jgi:hypothetical protein